MNEIREFLSQLDQRLSRDVAEPKRRELLAEIEGNLKLAARDVGEAEAVRDLGSAAELADGLIRTHRGWSRASAWRLALVPALWIAGAWVGTSLLALAYALLTRDPLGSWLWVFMWLPTLALIPFLRQAFCTRRWLWLPTGVFSSLLLMLVLGAAQWVTPRPANPSPTPNYVQMFRNRESIDRFRVDAGFIRPVQSTSTVASVVPYVNIPVTVGRYESVSFTPTPSASEWATAWSEFERRTGNKQVLDAGVMPGTFPVAAVWAVGHFAVLFALNGVTLGLRKRRLGPRPHTAS